MGTQNRTNGDERRTQEIHASYTATVFDDVILISDLAAPCVVTLPKKTSSAWPASGPVQGFTSAAALGTEIDIEDVDGANTITITPADATINGAASLLLPARARAKCTFSLASGTWTVQLYEPSGVVQTSFVFRPGGVAADNVYTDWPKLFAAANAVSGFRVITIDSSIAAAIVPAGEWIFGGAVGLGDVWIIGDAMTTKNTATLQFADGAHIAGIGIYRGVDLVQNGNTPATKVLAGQLVRVQFESGNVTTTTAAPFYQVDAGGFSLVVTLNFGISSGGGGGALFNANDGFLAMIQMGLGTTDANTLARTAGGFISMQLESPALTFSTAQAGIPGGVIAPTIKPSTALIKGPRGTAPALQASSDVLVAGVSAFIPATITANSVLPAPGVKVSAPGAGNLTVEYACLAADRVVGLASTGGGYKVTALLAAGTINVLDTSTLDSIVVN